MKNWSSFILCLWVASAAAAEPPAPPGVDAARVVALVNKRIVRPLEKAETRRKPFSRAEPAPKARRVRVVAAEATADAAGKHFVRFAVDELHPSDDGDDRWYFDIYVGCAYVDGKEVFVQIGADYMPASVLRGGDPEPRHDVCRPAAGDSAG